LLARQAKPRCGGEAYMASTGAQSIKSCDGIAEVPPKPTWPQGSDGRELLPLAIAHHRA